MVLIGRQADRQKEREVENDSKNQNSRRGWMGIRR